MRIRELIEYGEKSKIKAGDAVPNGRYPLFTSSEAEDKRYDQYTCDTEGIIMGTGGNATLHYYNGKFAVSTDCLVLKPNKNIKCKYLYYFFKANMNILQYGFKGAGLKHTNKNYIGNIELNRLPDIKQQLKIICKLDKISSIITKHKQVINLLDMLIKSQFVKMFGDMDNPKYPVHNFKEFMERCVDIGSNGSNATVVEHLNMKRTKDYAFVVRFTNLNSNDYEKDVRYIDEESYNFFRKSKVYGGEIIFCKIGSAGLNYIMPKLGMPVTLGLNQIMVAPKNINTIYLYNYLNSDFGYNYLQNHCQGAVTKSITKHTLWETPIVYPPIEEQNKFESFVKECDKLKFIVQKSLNKTQMLFDSLMQQHFS